TNIDWISRMIKKKYINFIDHGEFENPMFANSGGTGVIRKALWKTKNIVIILKQIVPDEVITEPEHQELVKKHTKNIVIKRDESFEDGIRVIIIDFGLSKVVPRNSTSHQGIKGHVNFIDPVILEALNAQFGQ
ncbi:2093_t:CDS:2, partial [Racocetra fulgida]